LPIPNLISIASASICRRKPQPEKGD